MNRKGIVLLLLALCASTGASRANSLMSVGPLAQFDEVSIKDIMVGDSLMSDDTPSLYQGTTSAVSALNAELVAQVTAHLTKAGLRVTPTSSAQIGFNVFGGRVEACHSKNFFMLVVWVSAPDAKDVSVERTVLGVVDDAELSPTLIRAALSVIDEFADQRRNYRESSLYKSAP